MSSFASRWISVFFAINGRQKGDSGGCWLSSGNHSGSFGERSGSFGNHSGSSGERSGSLRNCSGSFGKRRWSFGEGCGSLRNCCGRLADRRGRLQSWLKSLPEAGRIKADGFEIAPWKSRFLGTRHPCLRHEPWRDHSRLQNPSAKRSSISAERRKTLGIKS